ncbi:PrpF domain-containing protein [Streptomyces sclerotialus]|uniref:PrpF domain-containing protein n=1 Tax=Streptomyces sclerotialus TaxID=1957 RepID=UPI000A69D7C9
MSAHLAMAEGAPGPTLVLDASEAPAGEEELAEFLYEVRRGLRAGGWGDVLKYALVRRSRCPFFDLEYRFVQGLAGRADGFAFGSACGHSLLAAVAVSGLGGTVRVRTRTPDGTGAVVCEQAADGTYTVHFLPAMPRPADLLPTGSPEDVLGTADGVHTVSLVRFGNPYVFVDARELGLDGRSALFAAGSADFGRLRRLRGAARSVLGLPSGGALPKIAVVGAGGAGRLVVRALTEPGWHPSFAMTGLTCLAAATTVAGTVPYRLARAAGCPPHALLVASPAGPARVTATVTGAPDPRLARVSVPGKRVRVLERHVALPWRTHATA